MPTILTEIVTPGGHRALRSHNTGVIDLADADALRDRVRVGGPSHGCPVISILDSDTHFTIEGRRAFVSFGEMMPAVAVVVTNPAVRVMLNFVMRAAQVTSSQSTSVRFFSTEAQGLAWLDSDSSAQPLQRTAS